MSINAEEWFRQEEVSIETNIQVRYFVEMDDEYRNNIYRTIRGNDLDFIDVDILCYSLHLMMMRLNQCAKKWKLNQNQIRYRKYIILR